MQNSWRTEITSYFLCVLLSKRRYLGDWIARPLCDLRLLRERQTVVSALVENSFERTRLRDTLLLRIPDVALLSRKLLQGKAKLQVSITCHITHDYLGMLQDLRGYINIRPH